MFIDIKNYILIKYNNLFFHSILAEKYINNLNNIL